MIYCMIESNILSLGHWAMGIGHSFGSFDTRPLLIFRQFPGQQRKNVTETEKVVEKFEKLFNCMKTGLLHNPHSMEPQDPKFAFNT